MVKQNIKIYCQSEKDKPYANKLANELGLEIETSDISDNYTYINVSNNELGIINRTISPNEFKLDLIASVTKIKNSNLKQYPLAKAIGLKNKNCTVYDLTAGFLKDSIVLACLGHKVTAVEINPIIFQLINAANNKLQATPDAPQLEVLHMDSLAFLKKINQAPDIIYLDPMFSEENKTALAKKSMQIIQSIAHNENNDYNEIIDLAISIATKKVIVKRPQKGPYLSGREPNTQVSAKQSTRYDIYFK